MECLNFPRFDPVVGACSEVSKEKFHLYILGYDIVVFAS
jgi:hypothetical protein